jgi:hypothetical protein
MRLRLSNDIGVFCARSSIQVIDIPLVQAVVPRFRLLVKDQMQFMTRKPVAEKIVMPLESIDAFCNWKCRRHCGRQILVKAESL